MITALVCLFVLLSFVLVVGVPVSLATPGEWENSKNLVNKAFQAWVGLVFLIAAADGISRAL